MRPPEERSEESAQDAAEEREEGHVSFVRRLEQRFGKDVDPRIHLQREDDSDAGPRAGAARESRSRSLLRKLTDQVAPTDRYDVKDELARGGMGTILRVWDDDLRRNLAMKVLTGRGKSFEDSPVSSVDEEQLGRFLEEAQITGQLDHPGIVPVHDLGIDSHGRCYFTMRLVRGRELKDVLDATREGRDGWTITRALGLILKVCEAMAFAHSKGVVHRDLKPSNVMVGRFGEVYVMDWGLARVLGRRDTHDIRLRPAPEDPSGMSLVRTVRKDESELNPESPVVTMDGDVVGTPCYMAVEQARGKLDELGPRADVYALGAILYSMLTGHAPYVKPGERVSPHTVLNRVLQGPPEPVGKLARSVPGELVAICEKAMARDPEERYGSMLEVADDIQAFLENRVVSAYEGGSIAEARKWVARNRAFAGASAALILLALASAFGFGLQKDRQVDAIEAQQAKTRIAKEQALENLRAAEVSERQAQENLQLALEKKEEADRNARIALENEERARRSGYLAKIVAADYSLRLNDVVEARKHLAECDDDLRGWEWDHLSLQAYPSIRTFDLRSAASVDGVAFSPDGERVFYVTRFGTFRVLDADTGATLPPEGIVNFKRQTRAFLPSEMDVLRDGSRVALVGADERVEVFDLLSGERVFELGAGDAQGHADRTTAVAFSPDARRLASGAEDGEVIVWNARTGGIVLRFPAHSGRVTSLAWDAGSNRIASCGADDAIQVWSAETGETELVVRASLGGQGRIAWDGDARIASGAADGMVNLWDADSGRLVRSLPGHEDAVRSIRFDLAGERLLTGSDDRTLRVWDLAEEHDVVLRGHEAPVLSAAFSADGQRVLSGSADFVIKIWDARGDLSSTELVFHDGKVTAVDFHPDGKRVATAGEDGRVVVWDSVSGEVLQVLADHEQWISSVAFSADGEYLVSGSGDKTARLWQLATGRVVSIFDGHEKWVETVGISPDGALVATGSGDRKLRLWDARSGALLETRQIERLPVSSLAFSPDGRRLAAAARRELLVWDLPGLGEPARIGGVSRVRAIDFDPTGRRLLVGETDREVCVFDVVTGEELMTMADHEAQVRAVAFSPDGERFASASYDGTIRVSDAKEGRSLLALEGHAGGVSSLAFSPDGTRILSGSDDGTARVWETGRVEERRDASLAAQRLAELAEPVLEERFAEHFFVSEVVRSLEQDASLDEALRRRAVRLARVHGEDPQLLDEISRIDVFFADRPAEDYERAVRRSRAAISLDERNAAFYATLGVAQYRTAAYDAAIGSLERSRQLGPVAPALDEVIRSGFLALAHRRAGNLGEARRHLALAEARMGTDATLAQHAYVQELVRELASAFDAADGEETL